MTPRHPEDERSRSPRLSSPQCVLFLLLLSAVAGSVRAAPNPFLIETKKLTATDGAINNQFGFSVAISGNTALVGVRFNGSAPSTNHGAAYIFDRNAGGTNGWGQVKELVASDGYAGSEFGSAVAISGDTAIVGAHLDGGAGPQGLGSVYIFERNAGGANNWGEVKKIKAGELVGSFGFSVGISGNTLAVGAAGGVKGIDTGSAFVFERDQGGTNNWGKVRKLSASDAAAFDFFGNSIAVNGDTIVAGARGADNGSTADQGGAYVFERNQGGPNNWGEVRKLTASDGARNDQLGSSVAINGDLIVAGASEDDVGANADQGSAYLFERNQGGLGNWGFIKKLIGSKGQSNDHFGNSVATSGDRVVVGENLSTPRQVHVFDRNHGGIGNWGELQQLEASSDRAGYFGYAVAISGGTAVAGAPGEQIGANTLQGSAYIFDSVPGPQPAITGLAITFQQGGIFEGKTIAVVSDDVTPPGDLVVTAISAPAGITISPNFVNNNGKVSVALNANCAVTPGTYTAGLKVTDGNGLTATANLTINVTANTAPTLGTYPATRVSLGGSIAVTPSVPPSDIGGGIKASAPGFTGTLTVNGFGVAGAPGVVTINNAGPAGNYTVTVTATDDCGLTTSTTFALTVLGQMATITVNTKADTTANDGSCSLREAIIAANTNSTSGALAGECVAGLPGTDRVVFNIPGTGPQTIMPSSALPTITEPVIIDGLTQPGADGSTWPPSLKIVINGSNAGTSANGLSLSANAPFSTVRGLVINQFAQLGQIGILLLSDNNTIQGNFLGTDITGTARMGNGYGLRIQSKANQIGGITANARNLISGNNNTGVAFSGSSNRMEGNFIGTDVTGTLDLGNSGNGISASDSGAAALADVSSESPSPRGDPRPALAPPPNMIGGPTPGAGNIISGNDQDGIAVSGSNSLFIEANFIGTDVTGTARLGNGGNGIWIPYTGAAAAVVGGYPPASRNVISANGASGIRLGGGRAPAAIGNYVIGNYIGTDVTGTFNLGNNQDGVFLDNGAFVNTIGPFIGTGTLSGGGPNLIAFNARDGVRAEGTANQNSVAYNSIRNNGGLALNLGADGITPNDPADADAGPNGLQNFPVLTSAVANGTSTTVQGTFNSKPNSSFTIQFFSSAACSPVGNGPGEVWVGDGVVTTDGNGNAAINVALPVAVRPGRLITATATNTNYGQSPSDPEAFSTSEFSPCQIVEGIAPSPASQLLNIATRLRVQTGENVLIGGFIITGTEPKKVMFRAIGPSLASFFTGVLDDPVLELFQGSAILEANDDWKKGNRAAIEATAIPPSNDMESAIVRTLPPGAYTAIVRGKTGPGIGLVEAYDLDPAANSKLANISTRGFVDSGNDVMIGGFIVGGSGGGGATVVVRAIGPTLANFGIVGSLQDPTLDLVDANGGVLRSNNDWKDSQQARIEATGLQPPDVRESVVVQTLAPGNYTAIIRGKDNTNGVALVEVYNVE
jgi:CSLREA domain-containing protein